MTNPPAPYRIEPLDSHHDRAAFSCGIQALDRYFHTQAGQDVRKRVAACFVLVEVASKAVAGFYTLSATSVSLIDLPAALTKKLPRYPVPPATLMGRLAVRRDLHGQRLGETLLMDAFARSLRAEIASFAFIVDAKDAAAEAFYGRYGFRPLLAGGQRLFLPMRDIAASFG